MKIWAIVSRGAQKGEVVTPHIHKDGMYVVSPSRFKCDYIRVPTLNAFAAEVKRGLKGRMSSSVVKGPRLFSSSSIQIK